MFVHPMPNEYEEKVKDLLKMLQDQVNTKMVIIIFKSRCNDFYFIGL